MAENLSENFFNVGKNSTINCLADCLLNGSMNPTIINDIARSIENDQPELTTERKKISELFMYTLNNTKPLYQIDLEEAIDEFQKFIVFLKPISIDEPTIYVPEKNVEVIPLELVIINANLHSIFEEYLNDTENLVNLNYQGMLSKEKDLTEELINRTTKQAIKDSKRILKKLRVSTSQLLSNLKTKQITINI